MIMPCMNFTSAAEGGGSTPLVEDGSVLLGMPGAPGCTTTGFGSACASAEERSSGVKMTAASSVARAMPAPKIFVWCQEGKEVSASYRRTLNLFTN